MIILCKKLKKELKEYKIYRRLNSPSQGINLNKIQMKE